jgi:hypothetical protein
MPEIPLTGHFTTNYHTKSISRLIDKGVAEKLPSAKLTKIKSRQLSLFLDIFYPPPNFCRFEKNGIFQQPPAITLIKRWRMPSKPGVPGQNTGQ